MLTRTRDRCSPFKFESPEEKSYFTDEIIPIKCNMYFSGATDALVGPLTYMATHLLVHTPCTIPLHRYHFSIPSAAWEIV